MHVSIGDREFLRKLASEVAEIAALPVQVKTIDAWKALNGLRPQRPMFTIDQIPWHEMNVNDELTLRCTDDFARGLERQLRQVIYRWRHMPADMAVEPVVFVQKAIRNSGYGYERLEQTAALDPSNDVVGHYYLDQIKTDADIDKIRVPDLSLDVKTTCEREEIAHATFDGILKAQMQGMFPSCAPWDIIVQWRGVENVLLDLTDRPEFMHRMVERITSCYLKMLDAAEAQGLLGHSMQYIHCTGAWTQELPASGFDPAKPRTRDLWTFGMAQIFGSVSREMHDEFEIPYMQRIYSRFGLGYYGCCEPLDNKIDLIRKIPNVRKISMSPWANQENGARQMGRDYVFSRKPSPALLATDTFNPAAVEEDLRQTVQICKRHGCPLEVILKDISTVRYEPQRLWQWNQIARRVIEES